MEEKIYVHKMISNVSFGVFNPHLIKKMASAKVVTPELYLECVLNLLLSE